MWHKFLIYFLDYYPPFIAAVFLIAVVFAKLPAKTQFVLRALLALGISIFFAHLNRMTGLYPPLLFFPSGHTTFCLGVSISLGMLWPRSLFLTLPVLVPFGIGLVYMHYHMLVDVLGAIPLVAIVYGTTHWLWRVPMSSPPLDMQTDSP